MTGSIFTITSSDRMVASKESGYVSEDRLQSLLADYPQLLAGEQMTPDDPRRWILVAREFGVPSDHDSVNRWSVDHLFLDQEGVPTLVEVKRSSDTRIRREVVGQILDYAANGLAYWPLETLRTAFEDACDESREDADAVLQGFLEGEVGYEDFWLRVQTNLQAGRVRLVFVADRIPSELRRIVEFLNEQMSPAEVLAVEVKQYVGNGLQTLVPRIVGLTAMAEQAKGRRRSVRKWDAETFFKELERRDSAAIDPARQILSWSLEFAQIWWGQGQKEGSFSPRVFVDGAKHQLFAVWTTGVVEIYFQYHAGKWPFDSADKRRELATRLGSIKGFELADDAINRRPTFPIALLSDEKSMDRFLEAFQWFIDEVRSVPAKPTD